MSDLDTVRRVISHAGSGGMPSSATNSAMPKALCITGTPLPCTSAAFGKFPDQKHHFFECTVIGFTTVGFTNVPIDHVKGKFVQDRKIAKPVCEFVADSNQTAVRCYNWTKVASTFAKGARLDGLDPNVLEGRDMSWVLAAGDVLSCKLDEQRAPGGSMFQAGQKAAFTYPTDVEGDVLPAFSIVEVDLDIKSWSKVPKDSEEAQVSACVKGYGLGLRGVRAVNGTLNSQQAVLVANIPRTIEESYERQRQKAAQNDFVAGVFNDGKGCWYIPQIKTGAYCMPTAEEDFIGLYEGVGSGHLKIDLLRDSVYQCINVKDDVNANSLMDCAIAAGALSVFGHNNDFRGRGGVRSSSFGVPIIDVGILLRGVGVETEVSTPDNPNVWEFDAGFSMTFNEDDVFKPIVIRIEKEVQLEVGDRNDPYPPSYDMPLVSAGFFVDKAYAISIAFQGADIIWSGYLNANKNPMVNAASGANMIDQAIIAGKRKLWGGAAPPCVAPKTSAAEKAPKKSKKDP